MVKNLLKNSTHLFERQNSNILSAATIITAAVSLSALLGLIRNRLLVSYFYENPTSRAALDSYWVAFRLPEFVFQLLVIGALSAAFIPVFSKYYQKDKHTAYQIANSMMNLILLIFIFLSIIIFFFAVPLNNFFTAHNFSSAQLLLSARFTRIMLLAQFFFAVSNFLTGMIQANKRFLLPALSPLAYNLGIIGGIIFIGPKFGLYGPTIGVVIGAFLHLLLQLPLAIKLGFSYQPLIKLNHPGVKEIATLMIPRTLALSVDQLGAFVMVYLATSLSTGSLTIINLAQQLMSFPVRVFGMPIGQASLPFLSQDGNNQDLARFKKTFLSSLHQILYLALPATAVLLILRIPAVRLAYGASSFPWKATLLTGKIVAIYSLSIFAQAIIHLLTRAFYALHNTVIPLVAATTAIFLNIFLAFYLVTTAHWGVVGLAAAASVAAIVQALILFLVLSFKLKFFDAEALLVPILKMVLASLLTGLFLWAPMRLLDLYVFDTTRTINLILLTFSVGVIGATVYLTLSQAFDIKEFDAYFQVAKKIGNWRKTLARSQETLDTSETIQ